MISRNEQVVNADVAANQMHAELQTNINLIDGSSKLAWILYLCLVFVPTFAHADGAPPPLINGAYVPPTPEAICVENCDIGTDQGGYNGGGGTAGNGNANVQQNNAATLGITILSTMIMESAKNNQAEAAKRKADEALQEAEQKRQAEAQARRDEETKQRLLGGPNSGSSSGLSLMGVTQTSALQLMTGDQALAPMTTSTNQNPSEDVAKDKVQHTDAFNKGYHDGSQCFSQNAGPYCSGLTGATWQSCLDDYRSGYEVGTNEMNMKVNEATQLGLNDKESGKPNNGFNDPNSVGDCRVQLNDAYDSGYSQGDLTNSTLGGR